MINGIFKFRTFIRNARIEDVIDVLFNQPGNMSMCQLCRITFRFTWDGFNSKLVNLSGRGWRKDNLIL